MNFINKLYVFETGLYGIIVPARAGLIVNC